MLIGTGTIVLVFYLTVFRSGLVFFGVLVKVSCASMVSSTELLVLFQQWAVSGLLFERVVPMFGVYVGVRLVLLIQRA